MQDQHMKRQVKRIGNAVRPGSAGPRGVEGAMTPGHLVGRPAGAKPVRPRVSPPTPVVSLALVSVTGLAKRRHTSVWAMGRRPRNLYASRMPRRLDALKAPTPSA